MKESEGNEVTEKCMKEIRGMNQEDKGKRRNNTSTNFNIEGVLEGFKASLIFGVVFTLVINLKALTGLFWLA